MRFLTFDWQDGYAPLVTRAAGRWEVVVRGAAAREPWLRQAAFGTRAAIVSEQEARQRAEGRGYDAIVCQNPRDLADVVDTGVRTLTLLHATADLHEALGASLSELRTLLARTTCVFTSEFVRDSWQVPGAVVPPGLEPTEYGPYTGDIAAALVEAHLRRELAPLSAFDLLERAAVGLPLALAGYNPSLTGARPLHRPAERREWLRRHRLFLRVAMAPAEDAFNLPMLEAMASGTPVVTTMHPATPLLHGETGLIAAGAEDLRAHMFDLLGDPAAARRLGRAARTLIAERYPLARFVDRWQSLLAETTAAAA